MISCQGPFVGPFGPGVQQLDSKRSMLRVKLAVDFVAAADDDDGGGGGGVNDKQ